MPTRSMISAGMSQPSASKKSARRKSMFMADRRCPVQATTAILAIGIVRRREEERERGAEKRKNQLWQQVHHENHQRQRGEWPRVHGRDQGGRSEEGRRCADLASPAHAAAESAACPGNPAI